MTFSYEANFFLFATLEVSRVIAHHRGQAQPPAQQVPVLTGMPVSGMAYLDRPKEAGYFIFPDLSVRHEGRYRLSFNLYEETKKLEDTDKDVSMDGKKSAGGASPDASFDWRMEVKSDPFTVYSAKKFPGLAESTNLSRTVAEQGCRVRIRRDVRMRRRDGKGAGDYDEVPEEDHRGRAEEPYNRERSRSNSAGSVEGHPQDPNQRASYTSPIAPNTSRPSGGYLSFGGDQDRSFAPPQAPAPLQPAAPQAYQQHQPAYAPTGVSTQPSHPSTFQSQQPQPPSNHYQQQEKQHPQSAHTPYAPRGPFESDRRQSYPGFAPHPPQYGQHYGAQDRQYAPYPSQPYPPPADISVQTQLPPMKNISAGLGGSKYETLHSPPAPLPSIRNPAPLASPLYARGPEHQGFSSQYITPQPHQEPVRSGGKRQFDSAFSTSSTTESLVNGMRPSTPHDNGEDDDDLDRDLALMEYKRADGTQISRDLPPKLRTYGR